MSAVNHVIHQLRHAARVIRQYAAPSRKRIVDRHKRQLRPDQHLDLVQRKIRVRDAYTVQLP